MKLVSLSHLSDEVIDQRLASSISQHRASTVELLAHLAESDARRRFAELGYSSTHDLCVRAFHMSEDAAYKRIRGARAARRFPVILEMLSDGRLNLSVVVMLAPHLSGHTAHELLAAARHKTRSEVEVMLAARFPQPDLPTFVQPVVCPGPELVNQLAPGPVVPIAPPCAPTWTVPLPTAPPARLAPRSPGRYALQVMLAEQAHDDLRAVRELLGHSVPSGELAEVLARALAIARRELEKQKFAQTDTPRAPNSAPNSAPHSAPNGRHIPAGIKRQVSQRDQGRCAFTSRTGKRCESRKRLEFDHIVPLSKGGETTESNVRLLCRAHNQYAAECEIGAKYMHDRRSHAIEQRERDRATRFQRTP